MAMITGIDSQDLYDFTIDCFKKAGFDDEDSKIVADNLREADLRGLNTHGVLRIPMYLKRVRANVLDPHAKAECIMETPGFAIWDAKNGMGCLASVKAMDMAIEKCKENGIYLVGVRNSNHFGAAAYYTMRAASQNVIED